MESSLNVGGEAFLRQFDAVAFDAGEADFERVALGADGFDLNGLTRWLRRRDDRLGREVEGDAEDIGIFDVEETFFIQVVGLAAERASDDLFAQELGAEGANAEDVRDGVRIPAFREHGDGDDAADGAAELAVLADGVHDLAQQFLIGDVLRWRGRRRCARSISRRKRSISSAAMPRKLSSRASPASSCSLSMSSVLGRGSGLPVVSSKLRKRARRPFSNVVVPSSFFRWKPEMKS